MSPHWVLVQVAAVFVVNRREWPRLIVIIRKCAVICEPPAARLFFVEYIFVFSILRTRDLLSFSKRTARHGDKWKEWGVDGVDTTDGPKAFHVG